MSGEALLLAGRLDGARADLERSLAMHEELSADAGTAHSLQRLAEVELAEGDRAAAERLARRSLGLARWSPLARHLVQRIYGTLIVTAPDGDTAVGVVAEAEAAVDDNTRCEYCDIMLTVPATIALAEAGHLDDAGRRLGPGPTVRPALAGDGLAGGGGRGGVGRGPGRGAPRRGRRRSWPGRPGFFDQAGQPLDAARCREAVEG